MPNLNLVEQKTYQTEQRLLNRELSWLAFNRRVLEEAENLNHPLLERVRFLAISASNLDEFIVVRIAGIEAQHQAHVNVTTDDGLTPDQHLRLVNEETSRLMLEQQVAWLKLRAELTKADVKLVTPEELTEGEKAWLDEYFLSGVYPVLTPMAVDPAHPFPFIPNGGVALALMLKPERRKDALIVILPLPTQLDRFVRIPSHSGPEVRFIALEHVIAANLHHLFPATEILDIGQFQVLRDSEIRLAETSIDTDLVRSFESAIKSRYRGAVMRLVVANTMPHDMRLFLADQLDVTPTRLVVSGGMVRLSDVKQLIAAERADLLYTPYQPRFPERIREFDGDCFAAISHKDIIVHHPYESFDVVVQFIRQAANDPNVIAIKQTLYRTSKDSPVIKALIEAAEAGKSVTAMVELKARFDEEANIRWARDLEKAGAQIVFGFVELKTHAKMTLIIRKENTGLKTYAHFGTGNYHSETARVYTDLSFFTCDPALCSDAAALFNYMTGYATPSSFKKLAAAPLTLRARLYELIDREIALARAGQPAQIWAKMNALVDAAIIEKLYEASAAGVQIDLVVRGACCLRPGLPGLSDNIRVKSLIGRFLEHSRILAFGNGAALPSEQALVFLSSADWMPRNLDRRIETLVPIENLTVHQQVLDQILVANLKDNRHSWELRADGTYHRIHNDDEPFSAHDYFMTNPSLSGRGTMLTKQPKPPKLILKRRKE
jgi:polyphosphate kinase